MKYEAKFHVVLYQPEIPGNTGAVGRTCVAVGAKLWLVRPLGFRVDKKSLRRAGLDYWQHLEWETVSHWEEVSQRLAGRRLWLFSKTATRIYCDAKFEIGDAMVFGSETNGLPTSLLEQSPERNLRIPIREQVRSLNLASSVAIATYEALRQCTAD